MKQNHLLASVILRIALSELCSRYNERKRARESLLTLGDQTGLRMFVVISGVQRTKKSYIEKTWERLGHETG